MAQIVGTALGYYWQDDSGKLIAPYQQGQTAPPDQGLPAATPIGQAPPVAQTSPSNELGAFLPGGGRGMQGAVQPSDPTPTDSTASLAAPILPGGGRGMQGAVDPSPMPNPQDIAKMAAGLLPNPNGYTIGDALKAALAQSNPQGASPAPNMGQSGPQTAVPIGQAAPQAQTTAGSIGGGASGAQQGTVSQPSDPGATIGGPGMDVLQPDGTIGHFTDQQQLDMAIRAGGQPLDANGNRLAVTTMLGGILVGGQPLNVALGGQLTPDQQAALANPANIQQPYVAPGQNTSQTTATTSPTQPSTNGTASTAGTTPTATSTAGVQNTATQLLNGGIPSISYQDLGTAPNIDPNISADVNNNWQQALGGMTSNLNNQFDNYSSSVPLMTAAQLNTGNIPQPGTNLAGSNPALDFLMSGQGFTPATLALMKGTATDSATRNSLAQVASGKMAAQQAGLAGSGADLAMQNQAHRQLGDTINNAQNQIAIQNAQQAMQNLNTAAPLGVNLAQGNAQSQNQMALANAANLFQGMQQNVANSQQANMTDTANRNAMLTNRANTIAGATTNAYGNYASNLLNRANTADYTNTQNAINQRNNQAQLNQQTNMYNTNLGENRYANAMNYSLGLMNGSNPTSAFTSGANLASAYSPNLIGASTASNLGTSLINAATAASKNANQTGGL